MSIDLQASVVLIASSDPQISRFGTGFVIHQDSPGTHFDFRTSTVVDSEKQPWLVVRKVIPATFFLTCAHVVDDVGGAETIDIGGLKATVVALGDADALDLAVLRVEGQLDKSPLSLHVSGEKGSTFSTAGFQLFGRHYLIRPLQGTLGESVGLATRGQAGYIKAWDLKIEDDYQLQPGYSGSPVVNRTNGQVLGVVSHRQGQGERGLAISIEALPNIWPDMPADLLDQEERGEVATDSSSTEDTKPKQRVQIYLSGDFTLLSTDRQSAAIDAFAAVMGIAPQAIEVHSIYEGSIVFDLGVPPHAVERLRSLLKSNNAQLRQLEMEKVVFEEESGQTEEWIFEEGKFDLVTFTHPTVSEAQKEPKGDKDMAKPIEIFFSYAHEDEELRDELAKHLSILQRQGTITAWHDREITAGSEWAGAIDDHLNSADIILLLISSDFIASDYCYDVEMKRALERHEAREAVVIPVILRSTKWASAPFGKLQALPRNAKPVTAWTDRDEAFLNITEGIHKVAQGLAARSATPRQSAPTSTPAISTAPTSDASAVEYNTGAIRNLLKAAFSDDDFTIFCYDNFREVHDQFSTGMSFTQKTQRLIEYCERNLAFETLLELVEAENPAQYQRFASQLKR